MPKMRWFLYLLVVVSGGCYTSEDPAVYKCSKEKQGCPAGYRCDPGTWQCVKEGTSPDQGSDGPVSDKGIDLKSDLAIDAKVNPDRPIIDAPMAPDSAPPCVHPTVTKSCKKDSVGIEWCSIPAGCFQMGSPSSEPCRSGYETLHPVTLTNKFEIQSTGVTQGQFQSLMSYNPSWFGPNGKTGSKGKCASTQCPVEGVSWHEAVAFCNALSGKAGLTPCYACTGSGSSISCQPATTYLGKKIYKCPGYRLPTEAEREYAQRAGTKTAYFSGNNDKNLCQSCTTKDPNADKIGWYCANSSSMTHEVGQKLANSWGLHDLSGNLWEWTNDWVSSSIKLDPADNVDPGGPTSGTYKIIKGGAWLHKAQVMRSAHRALFREPHIGSNWFGFRYPSG